MKRQWFFWVTLFCIFAVPLLAKDHTEMQCPEMKAKLAELASRRGEVEALRLPLSRTHLLVVTIAPDGKWHLLLAEVSEFAVSSAGGLPVKVPLSWRLCEIWYGAGAVQGVQEGEGT